MKGKRVQLNMFLFKSSVGILLLILSSSVWADDLPKTGNFSLPTSQQPGSLLAIGQTIVDKGQRQINLLLQSVQYQGGYETSFNPNFTYGFKDELAMQIVVPYYMQNKNIDLRSEGLADLELQFEYAYYNKDSKTYSDQGTALVEFLFPTGSTQKDPATGAGAMSALFGTTFSRTFVDWYVFGCLGFQLYGTDNGTQYGKAYIYDLGFGRNIAAKPSKWIFAWLIEIDGEYATADVINFMRDDNSGGNVIYVTPAIWYSTPHIIFQAGIGHAVYQRLFGDQQLYTYLYALDFSYTFS
jgi:hypothetical protein